MNTIGRHLIAEFYRCNKPVLDDCQAIELAMLQAAEKINATVVGHCFHRYSPQGVSGTVLIAESHLSVHTWPEQAYAAVDIYTCGGLTHKLGFLHLGTVLQAQSYCIQELIRGVPEDLPDDSQWREGDIHMGSRVTGPQPLSALHSFRELKAKEAFSK
jgi:S-adenosylmethionine decarboxylase